MHRDVNFVVLCNKLFVNFEQMSTANTFVVIRFRAGLRVSNVRLVGSRNCRSHVRFHRRHGFSRSLDIMNSIYVLLLLDYRQWRIVNRFRFLSDFTQAIEVYILLIYELKLEPFDHSLLPLFADVLACSSFPSSSGRLLFFFELINLLAPDRCYLRYLIIFHFQNHLAVEDLGA